jgi:hypothetical protein
MGGKTQRATLILAMARASKFHLHISLELLPG